MCTKIIYSVLDFDNDEVEFPMIIRMCVIELLIPLIWADGSLKIYLNGQIEWWVSKFILGIQNSNNRFVWLSSEQLFVILYTYYINYY